MNPQKEHASFLVVELGKISIASDASNTTKFFILCTPTPLKIQTRAYQYHRWDKNEQVENNEDKLYDKFNLDMTSLQVFFSNELPGKTVNKDVRIRLLAFLHIVPDFLFKHSKPDTNRYAHNREV